MKAAEEKQRENQLTAEEMKRQAEINLRLKEEKEAEELRKRQ